jgi:hypothetical protein
MACSRCAEDSVLPNDKFLDSICSANLCNQLDDFGVVETAVSTNDEEGSFDAFWDGQENRSDEGLGIVGLLENSDFLSKTRCS